MLEYSERTEGGGHFFTPLAFAPSIGKFLYLCMYFRQKRAQLLWNSYIRDWSPYVYSPWEELKKKRPHMQKKKVLFYQGNTPWHKSMKTMVKLNELSFELVPHPPHSPNLAPSDYWLFTDLKKVLQGKRFDSTKKWLPKLRPIWRAKTNHCAKKAVLPDVWVAFPLD